VLGDDFRHNFSSRDRDDRKGTLTFWGGIAGGLGPLEHLVREHPDLPRSRCLAVGRLLTVGAVILIDRGEINQRFARPGPMLEFLAVSNQNDLSLAIHGDAQCSQSVEIETDKGDRKSLDPRLISSNTQPFLKLMFFAWIILSIVSSDPG
jgi:hypothetical protein